MEVKPTISKNIRIRYPYFFEVEDGVTVDDFCYFSTRVKLGRFTHVAASVSIIGGEDEVFQAGAFCGVGTGSRIVCASDDWICELSTVIPSDILKYAGVKKVLTGGGVIFEYLSAVGANVTVMPDNVLKEGVAIGSGSFVPSKYKFEPWTIYVGSPVRPIKKRNEYLIKEQAEKIEKYLERRSNAA